MNGDAGNPNGENLAEDFFGLAYTQEWDSLEAEDDMLRQAISSMNDKEVVILRDYFADKLHILNDDQLDHLLFNRFCCESTRRGVGARSPDRKARAHLEYIVQFLTSELKHS